MYFRQIFILISQYGFWPNFHPNIIVYEFWPSFHLSTIDYGF